MNTIKCGIDKCPSVFQTEMAVSPKATYVCKLHSKTEQEVFFQEHQYDKDLRRAARPIHTSHIHRQGEGIDSEEALELWREQSGAKGAGDE